MLPVAILSGVIAAIFGVVGFSVVKDFVAAQTTGSWSAAERSVMVTAVPIAIALMTFVLVFSGVTAVRGARG